MERLSTRVHWWPDHEVTYVTVQRGAFKHDGDLSTAEMAALGRLYAKLAETALPKKAFASERTFELWGDKWMEGFEQFA